MFTQKIAHCHRDIAEIDIHRTGIQAFVANGTVVGDIVEFVEMLDGNPAPGLLFVQKGFDQQGGGEYLVARRIQQVGARHVSGADRLALAATQAVLDRIGNLAEFALFQNQAFQFHQVEAGGIGAIQIAARQQLALVETAFRVNFLFVGDERRDLVFVQIVELGDADAVFAGNHPAQIFCQLHDAINRRIGLLQHLVIVRVHRNIGVHVAVTRMHVQCDKHAAFQYALVDGVALIQHRLIGAAAENMPQLVAQLALPRGTDGMILKSFKHGIGARCKG